MPLGRVLLRKEFFEDLIICTIKLWLEIPSRKPVRNFAGLLVNRH
jgi:hypothetical protein